MSEISVEQVVEAVDRALLARQRERQAA